MGNSTKGGGKYEKFSHAVALAKSVWYNEEKQSSYGIRFPLYCLVIAKPVRAVAISW
jgi:hypothetical protein